MNSEEGGYPQNFFGMIGMCYGQGRKPVQRDWITYNEDGSITGDTVVTTAHRSVFATRVKSFSSSFLCVGPRIGKEGCNRTTLGGEENIPENAPGPQFIPPELIQAPAPGSRDYCESDDAFSDARSTAAVSTLSRCEVHSKTSRKSRRSGRRSHATPKSSRCQTDLGYMTPRNLDTTTNTGFQTPVSDLVKSILTIFDEKRRSINATLENSPPSEQRSRLLDLSESLLDAATVCVKEPPSSDCGLVYNTKGLQVWKKEFGVGRLLLRGQFIAPVTPEQYVKFASNQQTRKLWDSNVDHVSHVENIGHQTDVCYTATKRVATIFPRDTVVLRVVRDLERTENKNSVVSCSCSVKHPSMPEKPGKVRADMHIGCYVADTLHTPLGEWSLIRMFHEGDPKGWIPASVTKMIATKVFPRSVEKILKAVMDHYEINWTESGCGTAMNYAPHMLERPTGVCKNMVEEVERNRLDDPRCLKRDPRKGSPCSRASSSACDIPVAQRVAPNIWRVE